MGPPCFPSGFDQTASRLTETRFSLRSYCAPPWRRALSPPQEEPYSPAHPSPVPRVGTALPRTAQPTAGNRAQSAASPRGPGGQHRRYPDLTLRGAPGSYGSALHRALLSWGLGSTIGRSDPLGAIIQGEFSCANSELGSPVQGRGGSGGRGEGGSGGRPLARARAHGSGPRERSAGAPAGTDGSESEPDDWPDPPSAAYPPSAAVSAARAAASAPPSITGFSALPSERSESRQAPALLTPMLPAHAGVVPLILSVPAPRPVLRVESSPPRARPQSSPGGALPWANSTALGGGVGLAGFGSAASIYPSSMALPPPAPHHHGGDTASVGTGSLAASERGSAHLAPHRPPSSPPGRKDLLAGAGASPRGGSGSHLYGGKRRVAREIVQQVILQGEPSFAAASAAGNGHPPLEAELSVKGDGMDRRVKKHPVQSASGGTDGDSVAARRGTAGPAAAGVSAGAAAKMETSEDAVAGDAPLEAWGGAADDSCPRQQPSTSGSSVRPDQPPIPSASSLKRTNPPPASPLSLQQEKGALPLSTPSPHSSVVAARLNSVTFAIDGGGDQH